MLAIISDKGLFAKEQISILDKANTYRHVLEHRDPVIRHSAAYEKAARDDENLRQFDLPKRHSSLFAGSTTSKFKGVPLYPEFLAMTLWPELRTISERARKDGSNCVSVVTRPCCSGDPDVNRCSFTEIIAYQERR
jgi:hypothetical protein